MSEDFKFILTLIYFTFCYIFVESSLLYIIWNLLIYMFNFGHNISFLQSVLIILIVNIIFTVIKYVKTQNKF